MLRKSIHSFIRTQSYSTFTNSVLKTSIKSCVCRSFHKDDGNVLSEPIVDRSIQKMNNREKSELNVLSLQISNNLTTIQNMQSLEELMEFLKHNTNIDVPLYSPIFRRIFWLSNLKSSTDKQQFIQNPIFIQFCGNVNKSVRRIKPSDLVDIIKTLVFLNISTNSYFAQNLLTVLSKYVNELNLRQIHFLLRLFRDCPSSPILDALKSALPLVFDTNVGTNLNTNSPDAVVEALSFASIHKLSFKSQAIIVNAAFNLKEEFRFRHCKTTVISLCSLRFLDDERITLYSFCLAKVNNKMKEHANFQDILTLTEFIVDAFLNGVSFFYDETFILNAVDYLITKNLGLWEAGLLMRLLNRISFQNQNLLNYTSGLISKDNFDSVTRITLISFVNACSDASYRPPEWDSYEKDLIEFFLKSDITTTPLHTIAANLMSLECWPAKLIEKVFEEDFINHWFKKGNKIDYANFLSVYQGVKTLFPYYNGPLPSNHIIEKCKTALIPEDRKINIRPSLMKLLQDNDTFILDGVMTKLGHYLEHVLILSKDGKPQPINFNNDFRLSEDKIHSLEDLEYPPNSHVVGVILFPVTYYCVDGLRLRGKIKMYLNSLKEVGVVPLPISLTVWHLLKDHEKLPYLKRELEAKVFLDESFQNCDMI